MPPRRCASNSGQATVEFALILPLFILLIVAMFDVTALVRDQLLADALARDAGRQASQAASFEQAQDIVAATVDTSGRSDARWNVSLHQSSLTVRVSLQPRASLMLTSLRWLGRTQHVVGSATFATEYELVDQ